MNSNSVRSQRLLACLGDVSRFRVMAELVHGPMCVTDLARRVELSQSCTTRHLQSLEREGIVRSTRVGKRVMFSVSNDSRISELLGWALRDETGLGRSAAPLDGATDPSRSMAETEATRESYETENQTDPAVPAASVRPGTPLEDFLL